MSPDEISKGNGCPLRGAGAQNSREVEVDFKNIQHPTVLADGRDAPQPMAEREVMMGNRHTG